MALPHAQNALKMLTFQGQPLLSHMLAKQGTTMPRKKKLFHVLFVVSQNDARPYPQRTFDIGVFPHHTADFIRAIGCFSEKHFSAGELKVMINFVGRAVYARRFSFVLPKSRLLTKMKACQC